MTTNEKINKLLDVYCDYVVIPQGEAYAVAFGTLDNLPTEELQVKLKDQKNLTDKMVYLRLIMTQDIYNVNYQATPYGREIHENGGWLNYIEVKTKQDQTERVKDSLELENLKLQNNSLVNELSNRKHKEEIDMLTIENLKLQNRNSRIWFFIVGVVLTTLLNSWKDILIYFGLLKS